MYIQSLEGSWLSHPFWKTKFVLDDPADLIKLHGSGVPYVWIDASKGIDTAEPEPPAAEPLEANIDVAAPPLPAEQPPSPPLTPEARHPGPAKAVRLSVAQEMAVAAAVVKQSKDAVLSMFSEARMGRSLSRDQGVQVVEDIAGSVRRNPSALISLARLKTRDDYTYMHSVAVSAMMIALAQQLGLSEGAQRDAGLAGLLHDVGKMLMPLEVLNKPGALTEAEFAVMRDHPVRGHETLSESAAFSAGVLDVALHHHERMDGNGYPHGLPADRISLIARMGAVCDVYDAVTSTRPYKNAWDPASSLSRMAQWQGHFDTRVFQAFVASLGIYPVGTLVRLKSQRLAVVVDQNPGKLTQPVVKAFYSLRSSMPIEPVVIDLDHGQDAVLTREDPANWGFKQLDALWQTPG
jgi:putative nucleotidyltransferase with HDIG domain